MIRITHTRQFYVALFCACSLLLAAIPGLAPAAERKPTLTVMIQEKVMGVFGTTGFEQPSQAETTLMRAFQQRGFRVIDPATLRSNITQAKGLRMLEGDDKAAAAVGLKHGAQYSIVGNAISKNAGAKLYGTQLQSIQATLTARLIRNGDARVIGSSSATAAQAHIDEVQGGAMAIEKAAKQLAADLLARIPAQPSDAPPVSRELALNINGLVSYRHLDFIMGFLEKDVSGIKGVELQNFTSGLAELEIGYSGKTAMLARKLATQRFTGFRLEPTHVTPNRIDIKAVLQR
ncbi:MAG: hypothetical protein GY731_10465 [Gammaproteobacteria bacterium]|nr:hypothetical protein [Gammaproteobacteria bacterium]